MGHPVLWKKDVDINKKMNNYLKIIGIINSMFRPQKTLKKRRMNLYNTALSALLYGSENWTVKARDARRITAAEMK